MEAFYTTAGIVMGILLPFVLVTFVFLLGYIIVGLLEYFKVSKEYQIEQVKKTPPYDLVETEIDLPTKTAHVRFWKGDTLVWDGLLDENMKDKGQL